MKRLAGKQLQIQQRKGRVRARIARGGSMRPRLVVVRTNKHIWLQVVDDTKSATLASAYDGDIKGKGKKPLEIARALGALVAERASAKKIKEVVFDRGDKRYHGVVREVAEGAREGGLIF